MKCTYIHHGVYCNLRNDQGEKIHSGRALGLVKNSIWKSQWGEMKHR